MADRIEDAKKLFGDIYGQVTWLAERLSEARILVGHDQCARCTRMSFEACKQCWCQEAARQVREESHCK